jgi:tetratricopeptide (TPR) repeat protein
MGNAYNNLNRFTEAQEVLERAHAIYQDDGKTLHAALVLNNLADSDLGTEQFDNALDCTHRALDALRAGHEQFRLVEALETIAQIHTARGDHHSATRYYRDALDAAARTQGTDDSGYGQGSPVENRAGEAAIGDRRPRRGARRLAGGPPDLRRRG